MLTAQTPADQMRNVAERYVKLVLAVGQHDADYVDAFYGPPEWRKAAEAEKLPLVTIEQQAEALEKDIAAQPGPPKPGEGGPVARDAELWGLRRQYLARQMAALRARVSMLQGKRLTFDEESRALYDAVAPRQTDAEFEAVLKQLEARLPGDGTLIERYDRFKQAFVIPTAKVDRVFREAIRACRDRILAHVELPTEELFTVEYVTGKSRSGYTVYPLFSLSNA